MRQILFLAVVFLSFSAFASSSSDTADIEKRIKPIGQVQVEGDAAKVTADSKATKAKVEIDVSASSGASGKKVYDRYCSVCHAVGVAGAPKFQDAASWAERTKKPMADLVKSVQNGLNAMPPKGMCNNCSDADFKAAITYMMPKK